MAVFAVVSDPAFLEVEVKTQPEGSDRLLTAYKISIISAIISSGDNASDGFFTAASSSRASMSTLGRCSEPAFAQPSLARIAYCIESWLKAIHEIFLGQTYLCYLIIGLDPIFRGLCPQNSE